MKTLDNRGKSVSPKYPSDRKNEVAIKWPFFVTFGMTKSHGIRKRKGK